MRSTTAFFFMLLLSSGAWATFSISVEGSTTVTAEFAPLRERYPDGRILSVVPNGASLEVIGLVGDGRGTWVHAYYVTDGIRLEGFVDARQTSVFEDLDSGQVSQQRQIKQWLWARIHSQ